MKLQFFNERTYAVIDPQADSDACSARGDRLMFRHTNNGPEFFVAPAGIIAAGYVIGIFRD